MKGLVFATGFVTPIGLQVQFGTPPPKRKARAVPTSSDDKESPIHSSSLNMHRSDNFTAGGAMHIRYLYVGAETCEVQQITGE